MKQKAIKAAPSPEPIDYLAMVREKLNTVPRSDFMRIAVDAKLAFRTIYSMLDENRDPRYSTVMTLYRTLFRAPTADRRKRP
jgi:DNA-binding phage protein